MEGRLNDLLYGAVTTFFEVVGGKLTKPFATRGPGGLDPWSFSQMGKSALFCF